MSILLTGIEGAEGALMNISVKARNEMWHMAASTLRRKLSIDGSIEMPLGYTLNENSGEITTPTSFGRILRYAWFYLYIVISLLDRLNQKQLVWLV